jgi:hypothetical protein
VTGLEQLYRLLMLALILGGSVRQGVAPHYAENVMERVADHRKMERAGCMVSSPIYSLGEWVYVYGVRTGALRYCRVTDVSQTRDRARHIRTGRIIEIDFENTLALCGSTRERPERCPVVVVRIQEER